MNSKNVLYIGGFELPDKNAAAQRVLANSKAIRESGYNVILAGVSRNPIQWSPCFFQDFKCYNLKYPTSSFQWIKYLMSNSEVIKLIEKEEIGHVICYNYQAVALYRLVRYARKIGIKMYADCTEWYEPQGNPLFSALKGFDVNFRMKYIQTKLDGLIVISDFLENYYENAGVKNIINIPPLVDVRDEKWNKLHQEEEDKNFYRFIYAGSPGNGNKDKLGLVVESLKYFYNTSRESFRLDVVGLTRSEYVEIFNNGVELNKEYDFIVFHGRIPHIDTINVLQNADYSIFFRENNLTNNAGFPTKFVESISAGTPVITNGSSNLKRYFSDKNEFIGLLAESLSDKHIMAVLNIALSTDLSKITYNKLQCYRSEIFDYRRYSKKFKKLLDDRLNAAQN